LQVPVLVNHHRFSRLHRLFQELAEMLPYMILIEFTHIAISLAILQETTPTRSNDILK
jgi:hypothetical protein